MDNSPPLLSDRRFHWVPSEIYWAPENSSLGIWAQVLDNLAPLVNSILSSLKSHLLPLGKNKQAKDTLYGPESQTLLTWSLGQRQPMMCEKCGPLLHESTLMGPGLWPGEHIHYLLLSAFPVGLPHSSQDPNPRECPQNRIQTQREQQSRAFFSWPLFHSLHLQCGLQNKPHLLKGLILNSSESINMRGVWKGTEAPTP